MTENNIRLQVSESSSVQGTRSIKLLINEHDTGVLYLTENEYTVLASALNAASTVPGGNVKVDTTSADLEEIDIEIFDED